MLAPVDMVLHAIVHLFYGGEMDDGLREVADIEALITHFAVNEPDFWEPFWPRVEVLDLTQPAFLGLHYSARLSGADVPGDVLQKAARAAPGKSNLP